MNLFEKEYRSEFLDEDFFHLDRNFVPWYEESDIHIPIAISDGGMFYKIYETFMWLFNIIRGKQNDKIFH